MPTIIPETPPHWPAYSVETKRLRISLRRSGRSDAEKLVLLHGWAVHGGMFEALREHLEENFELLVPDLRGHGDTDAPWKGYDTESLADDLLALLDEEGIERAHVAGYSWGGFIALAFAQRHPERIGKLGMLCSAPRKSSAIKRLGLGLMQGIWSVAPPSSMSLITKRLLSGPDLPEGFDRVLPWLMGSNSRAGLAGGAGSLRRADLRAGLPTLAVPTLVVTGGRDTAVTEDDWITLVRDLPQVTHRHFEHAGHGLAASHPDELGTALREFLEARP